MAYNKKDVDGMLDSNLLYQKDCVNYTGLDTDKEYYVEYISKYIKKNLTKIKKNELKYDDNLIRKDFIYKSHKPENIEFTPGSNRYETNLCRHLFVDKHDLIKIGKVCEYEANIVEGDHTNIDLISFDEKTNTLYLIEVKGTKDKEKHGNKYYSKETLLRCILEISTYYNSISTNLEKFIEDMSTVVNNKIEHIGLAILVPEISEAYREYTAESGYENLKDLLINPITIIDGNIDKIEVLSFEECQVPTDVIEE